MTVNLQDGDGDNDGDGELVVSLDILLLTARHDSSAKKLFNFHEIIEKKHYLFSVKAVLIRKIPMLSWFNLASVRQLYTYCTISLISHAHLVFLGFVKW